MPVRIGEETEIQNYGHKNKTFRVYSYVIFEICHKSEHTQEFCDNENYKIIFIAMKYY